MGQRVWKWVWASAAAMAGVLGCDREADKAAPADSSAADAAMVVAEAVTTDPFELRIGANVARLPAATLKILGDSNDGQVVLSADTGQPLTDGVNALFFQMSLQTDSDRPWTTGVWRYRLSAGETETTDGIYLGAPDNHLRPLDLEVEIVRTLLPGSNVPSRRVQVRLSGRFVSAEAADPFTAPIFEVSGQFEAAAEGP